MNVPRIISRWTPVFRQLTQRRSLSALQRARAAARNFEPHPFERYPITQESAKADWAKQFKKIWGNAAIYFPAFGIVLGWPLLAEKLCDGNI